MTLVFCILRGMLLGAVRLSSSNALYGHSTGAAAASHYEAGEPPFEEIEAQNIGNLLPNDDDDLLSGVTEGLDYTAQPSTSGNNDVDVEDLDLFRSVGGMDLGQLNASYSSIQTNYDSHPIGEQPSRTLFIRNISSNIEDTELQALFEVPFVPFHLKLMHTCRFLNQRLFITTEN